MVLHTMDITNIIFRWIGGVPEVITSDEYGLLVEPANPEDLAEKILVALDPYFPIN